MCNETETNQPMTAPVVWGLKNRENGSYGATIHPTKLQALAQREVESNGALMALVGFREIGGDRAGINQDYDASGSRLLSWLGRASISGIPAIEAAAKVLQDYYQGVGEEPEYDQFLTSAAKT